MLVLRNMFGGSSGVLRVNRSLLLNFEEKWYCWILNQSFRYRNLNGIITFDLFSVQCLLLLVSFGGYFSLFFSFFLFEVAKNL